MALNVEYFGLISVKKTVCAWCSYLKSWTCNLHWITKTKSACSVVVQQALTETGLMLLCLHMKPISLSV